MKNGFTVSFLLIAFLGHGQTTVPQRFSLGIWAGAELQTLGIGLQVDRLNGHYATSDQLGPGGILGVCGQWQLTPALQLRPGLGLSYTTNRIRFWSADGEVARHRYTFADMELPLHFILSDQMRHLPVKALILFGGRVSWNLARDPAGAPLQLLPERLGLDIGLGAGFCVGKWTVQPEFIYSYGVNNLHDFTNSDYDWSVGRVVRDRLSLRVVLGRRNLD